LSNDAREATPREIFRGPTLILGPKGCFLFTSAVEYGERAHNAYKASIDHDKVTVEPGDHSYLSYDRDEYVMWGFSPVAKNSACRRISKRSTAKSLKRQ
jgi:hypothetical protein